MKERVTVNQEKNEDRENEYNDSLKAEKIPTSESEMKSESDPGGKQRDTKRGRDCEVRRYTCRKVDN